MASFILKGLVTNYDFDRKWPLKLTSPLTIAAPLRKKPLWHPGYPIVSFFFFQRYKHL